MSNYVTLHWMGSRDTAMCLQTVEYCYGIRGKVGRVRRIKRDGQGPAIERWLMGWDLAFKQCLLQKLQSQKSAFYISGFQLGALGYAWEYFGLTQQLLFIGQG